MQKAGPMQKGGPVQKGGPTQKGPVQKGDGVPAAPEPPTPDEVQGPAPMPEDNSGSGRYRDPGCLAVLGPHILHRGYVDEPELIDRDNGVWRIPIEVAIEKVIAENRTKPSDDK